MEAPDVIEMRKNCNNREYVIKAVAEKGKLLEFAAPEFHDDEEIVKAAITQDGEAMEFVSDRLRDNKELLCKWKSKRWLWCRKNGNTK